MKLRNRDPNLKNGVQIRMDKMLLVLDWLLEFGCSSYPILARLLDSPSAGHQSRFFNSLIEDELVMEFRNTHTAHTRLIHLRKGGVDILRSLGRNVQGAKTRTSWMGHYSTILHDLGVQNCVLNRACQYRDVIHESRMGWEGYRPDAILYNEQDDYWSALEYERSRKSHLRVYESFLGNWKHIEAGRFSGVIYTFHRELDMKNYQKLFAEPEWPVTQRKVDTKVADTGRVVRGDKLAAIKKRFAFRFEPFWISATDKAFDEMGALTISAPK